MRKFSPGLFKDIPDWGRIVGGMNIVLGNTLINTTVVKFEFFF